MPLSSSEFHARFALPSPAPTSESNKAALRSSFEGHEYSTLYFLQEVASTTICGGIGAALLPLYCAGRVVFGRPPRVTPVKDILIYIRRSLFIGRNVPLLKRLDLFIQSTRRLFIIPVIGLAWHIDELLYGRQLRQLKIERPVFVISGARSGSTTLGHLLDNDNELVGPSGVMGMVPFLWMWKVCSFLSRYKVLPKADTFASKVKNHMDSTAAEFTARHETNIMKPDTFEVPYLVFRHFFWVSYDLGADCMVENFPLCEGGSGVLKDDFMNFLDSVMRKTMLWNNMPGDFSRRLIVKGHFLECAESLEERYEGAVFVTVVRDFNKRMESLMNFMIANRLLSVARCPVPTEQNLADLGEAITRVEAKYQEHEREFFNNRTAGDNRNKIAIDFNQYINDPQSAVKKIYKVIDGHHGGEVPPEIDEAMAKGAEQHKARKKVKYYIKCSLAEFGVDESKTKVLGTLVNSEGQITSATT